ncbi:MAG: MBL fold metallo-hydrolase [Actinomycetales bacterium]|nr:MBL fold metallo-hydrolase [Actinomycetales bacterium]
MSGRVLPVIGSAEPWHGGAVTASATCVLAPNPSPMTLDGTNTWILRAPDADTCAVVDPGPADPVHLGAILQAAQDARIEAILLTHGHPDHCDLVRDLAEATGAPVRALDPGHCLGEEGLVPGDVVVAGGLELEVLGTPGHTSDSVCLRIADEGSVLTGDTVLGRGTTVVAWPDGRLGDYLQSLDRLRDLAHAGGVRTLLPGHGPVLTAPVEIIDAYLDHRRARLAEVREAVQAGAVDASEVVAIVYAAVPKQVWPAAEWSVRAQLAYLAEQGDTVRERNSGRAGYVD